MSTQIPLFFMQKIQNWLFLANGGSLGANLVKTVKKYPYARHFLSPHTLTFVTVLSTQSKIPLLAIPLNTIMCVPDI